MSKKPKVTEYNGDVAGAVTEATEALGELRDELQNWYDNLPENFQNGDKGSQLQEAIDNLETAASEPSFDGRVEGLAVSGSFTPAKGTSRSARRDDAVAILHLAHEAIEARLGEIDGFELSREANGPNRTDGDTLTCNVCGGTFDIEYGQETPEECPDEDCDSNHKDEFEQATSDIEEIVDAAESTEFPGMYG